MDTSAFSSLIYQIKKNSDDGIGLSTLEVGIIGSLFLISQVLPSPIAPYLSQKINSHYIMFVGLLIWGGGVILTSISQDFWMLLIGRIITGIGNAPFAPLSYPGLMEVAPHDKKTMWIGIYNYYQILGLVLGQNYGPLISGIFGRWNYAFALEAFIMAPFAILLFFSYKDPKFIFKPSEDRTESLWDQTKTVLKNSVFVTMALAISAANFVTMGYTFWVNNI